MSKANPKTVAQNHDRIDDQIANIKYALEKARVIADEVSVHYFGVDPIPSGGLLAHGYPRYREKSNIVYDYICDALQQLKNLQDQLSLS
jgi:hypothetical protein